MSYGDSIKSHCRQYIIQIAGKIGKSQLFDNDQEESAVGWPERQETQQNTWSPDRTEKRATPINR